MEIIIQAIIMPSFFATALRLACPLILASLGETCSERSGVLNIGLEGMILTGAFAGSMGSAFTGNPWLGLAFAIGAGAALALLHGLVCITLGADQVLSGIALLSLAVGLTTFGDYLAKGQRFAEAVETLGTPQVPVLSSIPIVGEVLFQQSPLFYAALLLVPISHIVLFRTTWGLAIRAVGEHPRAVDSLGLSVTQLRYAGVLIAGILAGAAGAQLSLYQVSRFTVGMSAGRGFIALGAVVLGNWNPWSVAGASLIFGAAEALQLRLQALSLPLPNQLLGALPYLVTLAVVAGLMGRSRPPAALGLAYQREQK